VPGSPVLASSAAGVGFGLGFVVSTWVCTHMLPYVTDLSPLGTRRYRTPGGASPEQPVRVADYLRGRVVKQQSPPYHEARPTRVFYWCEYLCQPYYLIPTAGMRGLSWTSANRPGPRCSVSQGKTRSRHRSGAHFQPGPPSPETAGTPSGGSQDDSQESIESVLLETFSRFTRGARDITLKVSPYRAELSCFQAASPAPCPLNIREPSVVFTRGPSTLLVSASISRYLNGPSSSPAFPPGPNRCPVMVSAALIVHIDPRTGGAWRPPLAGHDLHVLLDQSPDLVSFSVEVLSRFPFPSRPPATPWTDLPSAFDHPGVLGS